MGWIYDPPVSRPEREAFFPTATHVRVLALAILLVAVDTLPIFLLGAGAVTIGRELGFGATGLGYLTAAFFMTAGVVSSPIGRLVERIGWQRAMRLNLAGTSLLLLAMSVAIRGVRSLAGLLVVAAVFYGFGNPAANAALAELMHPRRRGVVFGLKHAGIPTSTLLAGGAVPLIVLTVGWRWSYAAAAVAAGAVFALVPTKLPPQSQASVAVASAEPVLNARRLLVLAFGGVFATIAPSMLGTFTVTAAVDAGLSESTAGLLLSAGGLVTIAARTIGGFLADRHDWTGLGATAALLAIGAGTAAVLSRLGGVLFVVVLLLAFATAWGWPGLLTFSVVGANSGTGASSSAIAQAGVHRCRCGTGGDRNRR